MLAYAAAAAIVERPLCPAETADYRSRAALCQRLWRRRPQKQLLMSSGRSDSTPPGTFHKADSFTSNILLGSAAVLVPVVGMAAAAQHQGWITPEEWRAVSLSTLAGAYALLATTCCCIGMHSRVLPLLSGVCSMVPKALRDGSNAVMFPCRTVDVPGSNRCSGAYPRMHAKHP